ncbi:hypothetical protein GC173_15105 [bacterium]|nr:hypothetical protein [bacterium]
MRSLIVLSLLALTSTAAAQPGAALVDGDALKVRSIRSFEPLALTRSLIQSPRLVSRTDRSLLVWLEPDDSGRDRLFSLSLRDERQQDYAVDRLVAPVDAEFGGHSTNPAVALTDDGRTAAWAWLTTDGARQDFFVRRENGSMSTITSTEGLIEFPSVEFDGGKRLYAAWTQQLGGRTEAWVAWDNGEGAWTTRRLGQSDAASCDLLPSLFGRKDGAQLYWYSITGSEIDLRTASIDPALGEFVSQREETDIPAYRLPILFRSASGRTPGALWIEPVDGGEVYMALDERRADFPNPVVVGEIGVPPALATVSNDPSAALGWVERKGESPIFVVENPHGEPIRQPVGKGVSDPLLSVSRGWTNMAWLEQDAESGLSTLYFLRAR